MALVGYVALVLLAVTSPVALAAVLVVLVAASWFVCTGRLRSLLRRDT